MRANPLIGVDTQKMPKKHDLLKRNSRGKRTNIRQSLRLQWRTYAAECQRCVYKSSNRRNDVRHYPLVIRDLLDFAGLCSSRLYQRRIYRLHRYWLDWFAYQTAAAKKAGSEDGEINNQRKAFLDMLAWSEELITDVKKTRNHGYDVIVMKYYWCSITLLGLSPSNPTQINRRRTLPASFPLVGCLHQQLSWKTSRKVRTLWHCSRLKE